jgi:hypothetical protein
MSTAIYGKVTAIKAFPSTGNARVEIEIPVEAYVAAVNAVYNRDVLVTLAPALGGQYGVMVGREQPAAVEPAKPVMQALPEHTTKAVPTKHEQTLSQWAALRCKDPQFQAFLAETFQEQVLDETAAREIIISTCGISSRGALDRDTRAAGIFHTRIREPFATWSAGQ